MGSPDLEREENLGLHVHQCLLYQINCYSTFLLWFLLCQVGEILISVCIIMLCTRICSGSSVMVIFEPCFPGGARFACATKPNGVDFGVSANTDPCACLQVSLTGLSMMPAIPYCFCSTSAWQASWGLTDVLARAVPGIATLCLYTQQKANQSVLIRFSSNGVATLSFWLSLRLKLKITLCQNYTCLTCWDEHKLVKLSGLAHPRYFFSSPWKTHVKGLTDICCSSNYKWLSFLYAFLHCPETEISPNDETTKPSV